MPCHWEPVSYEEFRRSLDAGSCIVVVHKWTREWAHKQGWWMWGPLFDRLFVRRLRSSERDFWMAYQEGAFNLHLREPNDFTKHPH